MPMTKPLRSYLPFLRKPRGSQMPPLSPQPHNVSNSNMKDPRAPPSPPPSVDDSKRSTAPKRTADMWFYPPDLENDLKNLGLPEPFRAEALACAWEYTRCVIPEFSNWDRYVAFARIVAILVITEFRGELVRVEDGDEILGYQLQDLIDTLFAGTAGHADMGRECRSFLVISAEKTSNKLGSELFRRYVNALVQSPKNWFRLRDCDALARFSIAAALVCNDLDDAWFTEDEWQILTEIGDALYDSVAFFKHRTEGETNNSFAYLGQEMRQETTRLYREVLWAMDVAWAKDPRRRCMINFMRPFGGPIHMMMRRYRFVEDDLTIGNAENTRSVAQARQNFKLWNRVDADAPEKGITDDNRYLAVTARSDELLFDGFAKMLRDGGSILCKDCVSRESYGAKTSYQFGGVILCSGCQEEWKTYVRSLPARALKVFPELEPFMTRFL